MSSANINSTTPSLPVARYRLHFQANPALEVRGFMGSAWRGVLGHALKKTVCVTRGNSCESCILYESCVYPYIFETPPPKDSRLMRRYRSVPHPYILQLPLPGHGGSSTERTMEKRVTVGLVLVGRAQQQLPYLIHALQKAGLRGIGPQRIELQLQEVEQTEYPNDQGWKSVFRPGEGLQNQGTSIPAVPSLKGTVQIQLLTPFRSKREGHLVTPDHFTFATFFSPLMRRLSMLQSFHGNHLAEADFRQLTEQSKKVSLVQKDLHWHDWTRYSSRQGTTMQMGGIIGTFELSAEETHPFREWLWTGQWVHNGKGATMGLGQYLINQKTE